MNHYQLIGVPTDATISEIRAAYIAKVRQAHPDKGGTAHESAELNRAYGVLLGDRRVYDKTLALEGLACHRCEGRGYTRKPTGFGKSPKDAKCTACDGAGYMEKT